ncbi:MAG: class D sortase [Candidatus Parcubacteria bacterium]|nr:class D sortase [Candidatus Paceibacterota bacterium]
MTETPKLTLKPKLNFRLVLSKFFAVLSIISFLSGLGLIGWYFYSEYSENQETLRQANVAEQQINQQLAKLPVSKDAPKDGNLVPIDLALPIVTTDGTIAATPESNNGPKLPTAESLLRGLITIERFGTKVAVYETMDMSVLRYGLGHYPQGGWPGSGKQIFLAGHNNRELRVLKDIKKGDKISFKSSLGQKDYYVDRTKIVNENDGGVVKSEAGDKEELVLMTCWPFNSLGNEKERFLVYAY